MFVSLPEIDWSSAHLFTNEEYRPTAAFLVGDVTTKQDFHEEPVSFNPFTGATKDIVTNFTTHTFTATGFLITVDGCRVYGNFPKPLEVCKSHIDDDTGNLLDADNNFCADDIAYEIMKVCGKINFQESSLDV